MNDMAALGSERQRSRRGKQRPTTSVAPRRTSLSRGASAHVLPEAHRQVAQDPRPRGMLVMHRTLPPGFTTFKGEDLAIPSTSQSQARDRKRPRKDSVKMRWDKLHGAPDVLTSASQNQMLKRRLMSRGSIDAVGSLDAETGSRYPGRRLTSAVGHRVLLSSLVSVPPVGTGPGGRWPDARPIKLLKSGTTGLVR